MKIKITAYDPKFDRELKELDPDIYLEVKHHRDVMKNDILAAVTEKSGKAVLCGIGYLLASSSYRLIEVKKLTEYYIHAIFRAFGRAEAEGSVLLLGSLIDRFKVHVKNNPSKELYLRLWCRSTDTAYLELLKETGFVHRNTMFVMKRDLQKLSGLTPRVLFSKAARFNSGLLVKKTEPSEPLLNEYIHVNEAAFNLPDSLDDLLFKLGYYNGCLYCAFLGDKLAASVTTWRITEAAYATENIFCDPVCQDQGITRALLGFVLHSLKREGKREAVLTVYEEDLPALSLYTGMGYIKTHTLLEMHYESRPT
ncbi:MAG TPA: hypothetical protein DCL38_10550 [Lachnospiraceae bacterium]|nr:hypothetical protein [Lachnospiraceae bacterium]